MSFCCVSTGGRKESTTATRTKWHLGKVDIVGVAIHRDLCRFVESPTDIESIRSCFTGLYALNDDLEGERVKAMAVANCSAFVMKPQREGGGGFLFFDLMSARCRKQFIRRGRCERCAVDDFL